MNATPVRPVLYALTLSLLANVSGYAAGVREPGGETGAGHETVRKSQSALAGASAGRQPAAPHGASLAPKPAAAVARGYLLARPAADNRAGPAGLGSVGGPANNKTVINASINGSALRHRT